MPQHNLAFDPVALAEWKVAKLRIVVSTEARANLERVAREGGYSHARLSRLLRRGEGYIGRHIREGVPALLTEQDAKTLAAFTGSDPRLSGVVGY